MKTPLVGWNTLARIAEYLGDRTRRQWTVPEVLDLALKEHAARPGERPDPRPTLLSAALPADASIRRIMFIRGDARRGGYWADGGKQRRPIGALYFANVLELMAAGRTTLAFIDPTDGPDVDLNAPVPLSRERIEPPAAIPLDNVGALGKDVDTLVHFATANESPAVPAAESVSAILSERARHAADAAHKEDREMRQQAIAHYQAHRSDYENKDRAAEAIAEKIVPAKVGTVRRWLRNI